MTLTNPSLELTFTVNDVQHGTSQTIGYDYIVNRSVTVKKQLLNGLKSSSDTLSLQVARKCTTTEDIIATEGDIAVMLKDGNSIIFTGYVSTNFTWAVGETGEQLLNLTLETVGTRLLAQPYITSGRIFFDDNASSIIYNVCTKVGITIAVGHDRVLLQPISKCVEANKTCKEILDEVFYECNACYYFDNYGHLCVYQINPTTVGATTLDGDDLYVVGNKAVSLSKKLRQYKGARIQYSVHDTATDYLIYRNTTEGDSANPCNLTLKSGEYFDGTEIYTSAEWSAAQLDTFREPAYIGAVNASSESSIVGSNKIVSISNLKSVVKNTGSMTATFTAVGGEYFELVAHNPGGSAAKFTQLDLKADIVYEKSVGVIRTNMTGTAVNKATLEEEMSWIHDKDNAQLHANMVSQYHQYSGSTYSFNTDKAIALGSVVRINDNVHTGLDVYVLVTGCTETYSDIINYTGVGVSTFNLSEDAFYQTVEMAKQSGAAGPQGIDGASVEVQYALGTSLTDPPTSEMQWGGADMLWNSDEMEWDSTEYSDSVPTLVRGHYIWMRQRIGDSAWQYSRMTGTTVWDAENLGVCTSATPTQSKEGLGLIAGDYFVAGATFKEDNKWYYSGYAYTYNGSSWVELDLTTETNAKKALDLLGSLTSSGVQIASATSPYSMWTWTENLVAQNAVIQNLFAQAITILNGGYIMGGGRYNSNGTVGDWTKKGFWFDYNGTLKASLQSDDNGNTFVGTEISATSSSTGSCNTALGYLAMHSNVSGGDYNVGIGYEALYSATTGDYNIGIGYDALFTMQSSSYNIGIGYEALYSTTGDNNIAIGYRALESVSLGENNIGIGTNASVYSNTGCYQMSINNSLIYLEFKSGRTYGELFTALSTYFNSTASTTTSTCMGVMNDKSIVKISYVYTLGADHIFLYYGDSTRYDLYSTNSTTTTSRTLLFFINPTMSDSNIDDCLS